MDCCGVIPDKGILPEDTGPVPGPRHDPVVSRGEALYQVGHAVSHGSDHGYQPVGVIVEHQYPGVIEPLVATVRYDDAGDAATNGQVEVYTGNIRCLC